VLGHHDGIANYTVGQRKGLRIGGGAPLFVVAIDAASNRVIVGPRGALKISHVEAGDVVWHGDMAAEVTAMVRYRMDGRAAVADVDGDRLTVEFSEPLEGVAPGQAVVCYRGDVVVGGGVIECAS